MLISFALHQVSSWDEVDFSLAVYQFDLLNMQPHFPGYPYFILGGMLFSSFINNPSLSLVYFNIFLFSTSFFPIYQLSKRVVQSYAIYLTSMTMTISYVAIVTVQPMSEGAALSVLWWYLWSLIAAEENEAKWMKWTPAFLFSLLLGIRLSYIPFGIGLIWFWGKEWKKGKKPSVLWKHIVVAMIFQCIWVGGLVVSEGSLSRFLSLAFGFAGGHFSDWGGAVTAEEHLSFFERISSLLVHNLLWTGVASQSIVLLLLYSTIFLVVFFSRKKQSFHHLDYIIFYCFIAYFIWALFAQNIEKPRHILPLVALLIFWITWKAFCYRSKSIIVFISTAIVFAQMVTSFALLKEQYEESPAIHQLIHYLEKKDDPFIIYTWEETRVMEYYTVRYHHKRILTYSLFLQDTSYYENRTIYLTNHVLEGFQMQGVDISHRVTKVKEFSSNEIFDPIYSKIILYKWE